MGPFELHSSMVLFSRMENITKPPQFLPVMETAQGQLLLLLLLLQLRWQPEIGVREG